MKEYKLPIGCDVQTIILADGDFPSHPLALEWLRQCPYVVCCDGAANTYIRSGRMPEAIVGDGDSLLPGIKERYASLIHSETEQETNDLHFASACHRRGSVLLSWGLQGKEKIIQ